jgi:hypothetical protein
MSRKLTLALIMTLFISGIGSAHALGVRGQETQLIRKAARAKDYHRGVFQAARRTMWEASKQETSIAGGRPDLALKVSNIAGRHYRNNLPTTGATLAHDLVHELGATAAHQTAQAMVLDATAAARSFPGDRSTKMSLKAARTNERLVRKLGEAQVER